MLSGKVAILLLLAVSFGEARWKDDKEAITKSSSLKDLLEKEQSDPAAAASLRAEFNSWIQEFGKEYKNSTEDAKRFGQWKKTMRDIAENNLKNDTYWSAPNEWSDLTWEEFSKGFLGADITLAPPNPGTVSGGRLGGRKLLQTAPAAWDWVPRGKVTGVRSQFGCGACWAFAAAAAVESMHLIKSNKTWNLAEQQLVDCANAATGYQSAGCDGGWPTDALNYVYKYNLTTETRYPYTNFTGTCKSTILRATTNSTIVKSATNPGYSSVLGLTAPALMNAVVEQPVVVTFNAVSSFQSYAGGIYQASSCPNNTVNHAVLVVGYSVGNGVGTKTAFWKLKNSWGTTWGESGFARVQMLGDGYGACAMYYYKYTAKL